MGEFLVKRSLAGLSLVLLCEMEAPGVPLRQPICSAVLSKDVHFFQPAIFLVPGQRDTHLTAFLHRLCEPAVSNRLLPLGHLQRTLNRTLHNSNCGMATDA